MTKHASHWSRKLLKLRWVLPILSILITIAFGYGMQFLSFSTDYRAFFGKDNPQLLEFEEMQNVFNKDDNVLIVVAPKKGKLFTNENMLALKELSDEGWQVPFSTRVDSLTNFQYSYGTEDELIVRDLIEEPLKLTEEQLVEAQQIALKEPLLIHRLISEDGETAAINITVELPGESLDEVPIVANHVRQLRDDFTKKHPDFHVYLTGMVMLNNAFPEASQVDMGSLTPTMFAVILVLIVVLTRSFIGSAVTLGVIVMSTIAALGFGGYLGVQLTPISITTISVIMTLAVADCVHIILSYQQFASRGLEKLEAIAESVRVNFIPVLITSLTTAIGFLSLNFSDSPPYHDYGNMTALGVSIAFIHSIIFLPSVLAILPTLKRKQIEQQTVTWHDKLSHFVLNNRKTIFYSFMVLFVILSFGMTRITLNDQFVNYFDKTIEFRSDTDEVMKRLTGIYNLSFNLRTANGESISEPEFLNKVEEFSNWLRSQDVIVHVNSITDTFKRLNKNMNGEDQSFYTLPQNNELAAQYLLLYEMSLPFGLDLNSTININKDATKLIATLKNTTTVRIRQLEDDSKAWFKQNSDGLIDAVISSPSLMFSHISKRNISSMITGTIISMALITVIMMIAMRSVKYGLLSLIPNMLPVLMTFGFWGYIVSQIDMGVATIAGLTLGIVVDDTVHFMVKFLNAKREMNRSDSEAIHYAFKTVGPALIITSFILVCGFLIMSLSHFRMNWSMGMMSALTIGFALILDMFFLPILLTKTSSKQPETTSEPSETSENQLQPQAT